MTRPVSPQVCGIAGPNSLVAPTGGGLLEIENLSVRYRVGQRGVVAVLESVSLRIEPGETVAVVGESGSGKSTLARSLLGLLPRNAEIGGGRIRLAGQDVTRLGDRQWRALRGREVALIPQDPGTALNPVRRVGAQVVDALVAHTRLDARTARQEAVRLLAETGLADASARFHHYPHQLSGGMRQRVLIAIALASRPRLLVADEPTSALDVTVQRKILDYLGDLSRSAGTSILLVTHDLDVAAERADRILVMSAGHVVEQGSPAQVLATPRHARTRSLVQAAGGLAARPALPAPSAIEAAAVPLVRVVNLVKEFRHPGGDGSGSMVRAVDGVSFTIGRGRTFALVGESGSGKTTTARMLLRLEDPTEGVIEIGGQAVAQLRGPRLRALRRKVQVVYQNPFASLNPRLTIRQIIIDPLVSYGLGTRAERRIRAAELAELVSLPSALLDRKPRELSGGQRQRAAIARALALEPQLVVCDEPVSALDASVQGQILELLVSLQDQLGVSYLFISHDLTVVRHIAHEVGVMRRGSLVESGPTQRVLTRPEHPYTAELLAAAPRGRQDPGVNSVPEPNHTEESLTHDHPFEP